MSSALRKLLVLLASLALALGLFLIYNRISGNPVIEIQRGPRFNQNLVDSNAGQFDKGAGKIGDFVVETVKGTQFTHRNNKTGAVDRKFGFKNLLHSVKDIWEVEGPYMSVIQTNFECHITADYGSVQLETALGDPTPKDATFTGNVVIHIIPKGTEQFTESFIYLENIIFLSDKSQFSTIGPVRFVSDSAKMQGKGLEFVYDEQAQRFEYLRLSQLETLQIKTIADALLSEPEVKPVIGAEPNAPAESASTVPAQTASNSSVVSNKEITPVSTIDEVPDSNSQKEGEYYKCILSKNVLIEAPDQVVYAAENISLKNIFWSKSGQPEEDLSDETETPASDVTESPEPVVASTPPEPVPVTPESEPNKPEGELVDIFVTCDNGILLVPETSNRSIEDFRTAEIKIGSADDKLAKVQEQSKTKTTFITGAISYNVSTRDTNAVGPSDITFFAKNASASDANSPPVPINITSDKSVRYLHAANQVIFDVNCICTMPQTELSTPRDAIFTSPKITVDLLRDVAEDRSTSADLTAAGPVSLQFYVEDPNKDKPAAEPVPVTVTAQKHARYLSALGHVIFDGDCVCEMPQQGPPPQQNYTLTSPTLTVHMAKQQQDDKTTMTDVVASGPVNLTFYLDDFGDSASNAAPLPATVIAQKNARYSAQTNQIIFDGDCLCTMERTDPNMQYEYTLESPTLTIDLPEDSNETPASKSGIKHFVANGGLVKLSTKKWPQGSEKTNENLFAGVELQARQFDYDPNEEVLLITGPGVIWLNNSKVAAPDPNVPRASLRKPCYVKVSNFDNLQYFLSQNHFIANASSKGSLQVDYLPLKEGQMDQHIIITAGHIEAHLYETELGDIELSSLIGAQGISCEDDKSRNQFEGSDLIYDHSQGIMTITGNRTMPCMLNGTMVDGIQYDLQKDSIRATPVGPGTLQLN